MNNLGKTIGGTQSVERALDLLRLLASHHDTGLSLPNLIAATSLKRPTVYRLVSILVHTGFLQRDIKKRYRLGIESMQLGLAAMSRAPLLEKCLPALQTITRHTEDTVYLVVRNGDYSHCLHREEGTFPIKTFTAFVGSMRLLGLGTGSQALLATLSDGEVGALYRRHEEEYVRHAMSLLRLQETIRRTRHSGYAETEDLITLGVCAVGKAFAVTPGTYAAISVAAIKSRMALPRRKWIADVVATTLRDIGFSAVSWKN